MNISTPSACAEKQHETAPYREQTCRCRDMLVRCDVTIVFYALKFWAALKIIYISSRQCVLCCEVSTATAYTRLLHFGVSSNHAPLFFMFNILFYIIVHCTRRRGRQSAWRPRADSSYLHSVGFAHRDDPLKHTDYAQDTHIYHHRAIGTVSVYGRTHADGLV